VTGARSRLAGLAAIRGVPELALALVYFGAAKLGLALAFDSPSVTAVWPPTGIALAALVLGGRRLWPGVLLGAFLANVTTDVPVYTAAGIAVGNTLEAVVGAWLLDRARFRPALLDLRDVFALVLFGAVISTTVSATIGVASLSLGDSLPNSTLSTWRIWWLGDLGGDLLVATSIFVLVTHWPYRTLRGREIEAAALLVSLVVVELLVFTGGVRVAYLAFPIVIWAALRFLQPGACVAALLLAIISVAFTVNDQGPFVRSSQDDSLLLSQTFSATVGLTGLILAVVTYQRRRAERRTQQLARALQAELLPPEMPQIPKFEAAGWYRAGVQDQDAGGDFYDVFDTSEGRWLAVIGDVCGKGPEAASLTALARYTLRAVGRQAAGPSEALRALNEAILEQRSDHRFMTAVLVQLETDGAGHGVSLSNGGHPPPILVRSSGEVEEISGQGGMLLGIYSDPELVDQRVELGAGDALVLFTDGLAERRDPNDDIRDRIERLLRESGGSSAGETAARLGDLAMSGGNPGDDVAVVVLRRLDSGNGDAGSGESSEGESMTIELEAGTGAPAEARSALSPLAQVLGYKAYMDLCLLVSELVTNSVRHAGLSPGEHIRLRVAQSEQVLRVEVTDHGTGFDLAHAGPGPTVGQPGGWGLFLTEQLAERWGVDRRESSTTVWLEMDLEPPERAAASGV
jgi:integral membrane sensor domain MASE1/anti-sigma regulatory factor (Ser/Thr protein kinase)